MTEVEKARFRAELVRRPGSIHSRKIRLKDRHERNAKKLEELKSDDLFAAVRRQDPKNPDLEWWLIHAQCDIEQKLRIIEELEH